ncbi:MAG: hypothetical protein WCF93_01120 [Candidatus Moraniibacteriota bacterium]|jgi:hypothetical protein
MEWAFSIIAIVIIASGSLLVGLKKSLKIFFLSNKEEPLIGEMVKTGAAAILYAVYHYSIAMVVAATIVVKLRTLGYSFWIIVIVMWTINALNGLVVLKINDKSNVDLTLYVGARRMVNALTVQKKTLGLLSEIFFVFKLIFWDGPGELAIFLRPRIASKKLVSVIFLVASGVQMVPWVVIYLRGYDGLIQLFLKLRS